MKLPTKIYKLAKEIRVYEYSEPEVLIRTEYGVSGSSLTVQKHYRKEVVDYITDNYRAELVQESRSGESPYSNFVQLFLKDIKAIVSFQGSTKGLILRSIVCHPGYINKTEELVELIRIFKVETSSPASINIMVSANGRLGLSSVEFTKPVLDLSLGYGEEFIGLDKWIKEKLDDKDGKGVVLLHGPPGTGKTTYINYLCGELTAPVIYVPQAIAAELDGPQVINLLTEQHGAVLVFEDAENLISNEGGRPPALSTILNISDGILSSVLSMKILATFNTRVDSIDPALLRKGRLVAKHEFKALDKEHAQKLIDKLGLGITASKPMTLAEIYGSSNGPESNSHKPRQVGFSTGEI